MWPQRIFQKAVFLASLALTLVSATSGIVASPWFPNTGGTTGTSHFITTCSNLARVSVRTLSYEPPPNLSAHLFCSCYSVLTANPAVMYVQWLSFLC